MSRIIAAEPPPSSAGGLGGLNTLTLMLADGWQIEAPVLARLSWAQRRTGELAYHIILTRATRRSLIVIADSPEVHHFLSDQGISIV